MKTEQYSKVTKVVLEDINNLGKMSLNSYYPDVHKEPVIDDFHGTKVSFLTLHNNYLIKTFQSIFAIFA